VAEGYTTIISPRGQRTKVILPDQTNVWLNSESTLRYPATYNRKDREVHLEGEGFFEVSKDKQKPFFVQTEELRIKVYGTSFNLKAFPGEKNIEATLIEGKMSVTPFDSSGAAGKEIFLKPKEKLIYQKNAEGLRITKDLLSVADTNKINTRKILPAKKKTGVKIVLEKDVNTSKDMLWKEGKLIFNNETFGELSVRLERWYDVKIHFQDEEIKKYKFTGEFSKETADQAMEALKISSRHSYEYKMIFRDIYLRRSSNRNIFSN
jgi:transmembrane sensor